MATTTRIKVPKKVTRKSKTSPAPRSSKSSSRSSKSSSKGSKGCPKPSSMGFMGRSPLSMVVYGPPGVGKTSFAAEFLEPGFVIDPQEEGIRTLVEYGLCKKPKWIEEAAAFPGLLKLCERIASGKMGIRTAVFDSLTGFEKLCFQYHCKEYFDDDWSSKGFYSYYAGPKNAAKTDWPRFLDALDMIRAEGINVILIAHSVVKPFANPEGQDYDRYKPYIDNETWLNTNRWAKAVLFYTYHVETEKKGPKAKAKTDIEERHIYTQWCPAYEAKNQYGLPPLIEGKDQSARSMYQAFEYCFQIPF